MATIEEYASGEVCNQLKQSFSIMDTASAPLKGTKIGDIMLSKVKELAPKKITLDQAVEMIETSGQCAVGQRVCLAVHKEAPCTESVFLDDLSEGMAKAGKARIVDKTEAIAIIKKYAKNPIIASKVSGKYAEICPTWPKRCLYWNMEKHKLKCILR